MRLRRKGCGNANFEYVICRDSDYCRDYGVAGVTQQSVLVDGARGVVSSFDIAGAIGLLAGAAMLIFLSGIWCIAR